MQEPDRIIEDSESEEIRFRFSPDVPAAKMMTTTVVHSMRNSDPLPLIMLLSMETASFAGQ